MRFCEWFSGCVRAAAGVVYHPILGDVPCCRECAERLDLDLWPVEPDEPEGDRIASSGDLS